jgi:hypothetical protein
MPTRSGLDFQTINPEFFVCAYCYRAAVNCKYARFEGMVRKPVRVRVDDSLTDFETIPGEYTSVWTDPHCFRCHRQILGYPTRVWYSERRYTY